MIEEGKEMFVRGRVSVGVLSLLWYCTQRRLAAPFEMRPQT